MILLDRFNRPLSPKSGEPLKKCADRCPKMQAEDTGETLLAALSIAALSTKSQKIAADRRIFLNGTGYRGLWSGGGVCGAWAGVVVECVGRGQEWWWGVWDVGRSDGEMCGV